MAQRTGPISVWAAYLFEMRRKIKLASTDDGYDYSDFFGYGKRVMNSSDGNATLKKMITEGEPFCAARMGDRMPGD